jgi:alkylation response protein AidB-like acyl-CoA dehydrogenase
MGFRLSSEQRLLQESVQKLVQRDIEPILKRNNPNAPLPRESVMEIVRLCSELGLTSGRLPESAGGAGLSALSFGIMKEQLPPVVSSMCGVQEAIALRIHLGGTPEQSERFVKDLVSGRRLSSSGTTEPNSGSDPRGVKTTARPEGDGLVLNGQKSWVSGATICDVMLTLASTGQDDRGRNATGWIIVERDQSPFEVRPISTLGFRQGHIGEVFFRDCRVPAANSIGAENAGPKVLQQTWLAQRPMLGLLAVNMAQKALDAALLYAGQRVMFDRRIGGFQLVQELLANISAAVVTSRLLCYYALDCIDNGAPNPQLSAMAKRYSIDACNRAISMAMEVHGAMGISTELGLEQLYRDVRMLPIADGTNQILTLIEGRELTGISAIRG